MTYKRIKWLILWTPTLTVALWEYLRHTLLLPYLSMGLGNALTPLIVITVTATLLLKLFRMLEDTQETLQQSKAAEAAFMEREQLARELHDGISQSLFLLSVKLDKLEQARDPELVADTAQQLRRTVKHVYEDVRQSIASLRSEPSKTDVQWMQAVRDMAAELSLGGLHVELDWRLTDAKLTGKEKVELLAIVREAMLNVQKHAGASRLVVRAVTGNDGDEASFRCTVRDDGVGAEPEQLMAKGRYGVRMMQGRADAMGWQFSVRSVGSAEERDGSSGGGTIVEVLKGG
ncbi:sensor histidine kinase [Paenibacillus sacheonensis]|uniref:histidine kinase n=1 Tax=Paenibacillus sacheonensis TaxID=742054 RepID=A0A7X5BYJ3_9BACL|nr:histidine kinase [Paenibacillus sacheonensis]MBM7566799.1 two-component system nitrate/nitrite sensor histidine kinase NarQ [Paenibacillus sacheonensis]NBC71628.1 sensor histidine kinase [Paenibacillus sacheonensis]